MPVGTEVVEVPAGAFGELAGEGVAGGRVQVETLDEPWRFLGAFLERAAVGARQLDRGDGESTTREVIPAEREKEKGDVGKEWM